MEKKCMKQKVVQKETPAVKIEGLDDFPLETVGITVESIERSDGHVRIPIELMPFLKLCRMPAVTRKKKAEQQHRYLLRVKKRKRKHQRKRRAHS